MQRDQIERLNLHFQPIAELGSGAVIAAEALLRTAEGKPLPAKVTEHEEEDGGIFELDAFIVREACLAAKQWREEGLETIAVHVNVSALELQSNHITEVIAGALDAANLEPSALQLEITETGAIDDLDAAAGILERLGRMGAEAWLDDFGTGHSSLAWLKDFRVKGIKLPQILVRDIATDPRSAAIVAATIALAHQLSMRVIAEGVENERQVDILRAADCDAIQGFYIAHPVPAHELRADVGRRRRRRS